MKIDGLFPRWRVVALGAINGLIFSLITKVAMRIDYEYTQRELAEIARRDGDYICIIENPFKWWVIPSACVIVFALVSYAIDRVYLKRVESPTLFWGIVGFIAGAIFFLAGYLSNKITHLISNIEHHRADGNWGHLPNFFSFPQLGVSLFVLAVLVGLLYGSVLRFASAQYSERGKTQAQV